jgi:hypothetical protein
VRELRVNLGDTAYELTVASERIEGFRKREVGGIAIKREPLDPGEWVSALAAGLREESRRSAQARTALEKLMG